MSEMLWVHEGAAFSKIISNSNIKIRNAAPVDALFKQYGEGYYHAAHLVAEYMVSCDSISELDTYFFALVYLYRHSLELQLKAIGFQFIMEDAPRANFIKTTFHNLALIFSVIKPYISTQDYYSEDGMSWLEQYLENISEKDKESDSFRYPFTISVSRDTWGGKRYCSKPLFETQTHIDLLDFANKMEIAYAMLDCIYQKTLYKEDEHLRFTTEFLQEGGSYHCQCVIGYGYAIGKFFPFIKAYSEVPEMLMRKVLEGNGNNNALFIPACYLYRNAVELALKGILYEESLHDRQESLRLISRNKHKIWGLWQSIRNQIVDESGAPEGDDTVIHVDEYISQLHNYDPSSSLFRYPVDKYLAYHFKTTKVLDIENVDSFFRELISFLEAVDSMLSHHNDIRAEMEAEARSNMELDYY